MLAAWALFAQVLIPALQGWHLGHDHAPVGGTTRAHSHAVSACAGHVHAPGATGVGLISPWSPVHEESPAPAVPHDHDSCPTCLTLALSRQTPIVLTAAIAPALLPSVSGFVAAPHIALQAGIDPTPRSSRGPPRAA